MKEKMVGDVFGNVNSLYLASQRPPHLIPLPMGLGCKVWILVGHEHLDHSNNRATSRLYQLISCDFYFFPGCAWLTHWIDVTKPAFSRHHLLQLWINKVKTMFLNLEGSFRISWGALKNPTAKVLLKTSEIKIPGIGHSSYMFLICPSDCHV